MAVSLSFGAKLVNDKTGGKLTCSQPVNAGHDLIGVVWEAKTPVINGGIAGSYQKTYIVTPEGLEKAGWRNA